MIKKLFLIIVMMITFGQYLFGEDYYNYGQWQFPEATGGNYLSAAGFIDKNGRLGEPGKEYIFFTGQYGIGYIYRVETDGNPQSHPENPDAMGIIAPRIFTFISKHKSNHYTGGTAAFHVDDTGIYYGASTGIKRWDFDWGNEKTIIADIANVGHHIQTFTKNSMTGDWWIGDDDRNLYKWDGVKWKYQLTYPYLGGGHHDGMTIANNILFVSDMTSDRIATYTLDTNGDAINPFNPNHIFRYSASPVVEGMGFGPNNHLWITSGREIYEIGGGKLQKELASCTQALVPTDQWEMLSSRCDIQDTNGFRDTVIMKMVEDHLVVITDDNETKSYYEGLGYETNRTLALSRGEGFWVRAEVNGTHHALHGITETTAVHLQKDTTRFIGFPDHPSLDLDSFFGNKPVKEIRYWDKDTYQWKRWQPNHVETDLHTIVDGHGFYICIANDFDIPLSNIPPYANAGIDRYYEVTDKAIVLDGSLSSDADGQIVSYLWREGNQTLGNDSIIELSSLEIGKHVITLEVTDNKGAKSRDNVIIVVSEKSFYAHAGEDKTIYLGQRVILDGTKSRSIGRSIRFYKWNENNISYCQSYDHSRCIVTGLPLGIHTISLTISDSDQIISDSDEVNITVIEPELYANAGLDRTVYTEQTIRLDASKSYSVGSNILHYAWYEGNISYCQSSNCYLSSLPKGDHTFTLEVRDGLGNRATDTVIINIKEGQLFANAGRDKSIYVGQDIQLDGSRSYSIGHRIVNYRWHEGNTTYCEGQYQSRCNISGLSVGSHTITLTVRDTAGIESSDQADIKVDQEKDQNSTLMADAGLDQNIYLGENSFLNGNKSYTRTGYIENYIWREGNTTYCTGKYSVACTISQLSVGVHTISLEITNSSGEKDTDEIDITVTDHTLSADAGLDQEVFEGTNVTVNGAKSNAIGGHITSYVWSEGNITYCEGAIYRSCNITDLSVGEHEITLKVIDTIGLEAYDRVVVVVHPNMLIAHAGEDQSIDIGTILRLDARKSHTTSGYINHYLWSEGNMTYCQGIYASRCDISGLSKGIHTIRLDVRDTNGLNAHDEVNISIHSVNTPIAYAGKDQRVEINQSVSLDGSKSYASETRIIEYLWKDDNRTLSTQNRFSISDLTLGIHTVVLTIIDDHNQSASDTVIIEVLPPDTTPPVITMIMDNPLYIVQETQAITFMDPGVAVVDDRDGVIGYQSRHNVRTNIVGKYTVTYYAVDRAGNRAESNRTVIVRDPQGNRPPIADAGEDKIVPKDDNMTLDASHSYDIDGEIVSYQWREGNVILSTESVFSNNDLSYGLHEIMLVITDNEGASTVDTVIVRIIDPLDTTAPQALITTPMKDTRVALQTDIIGTAKDENLKYYELLISPVGKNNYIPFARGENSITAGVLGSLETSTIQNGIYDLLLKVVDINDEINTSTSRVIIEGRAKIGNFSFTITDFDIQVGGIPVQVNRTYSTLQRYKQYDFTYGWSIDYQNVKLEENIHPGKSWKMTDDVLIGSCFKPKEDHIVNITLPDGTTESFEFKFAVECGHYFAGSLYNAPILKPLNGTTATLEAIDASESVYMNNDHDGEIIDGDSFDLYNPRQYRLTLANGMVYEIDEREGIMRVQTLRGDYLEYTHEGIISSRLGEALRFERDDEDRIIRITDLSDKNITYHYNQNDDMDHVIDQGGGMTQYRYETGHLMSEYYDPSGLRVTKNFYDDAGRLTKTIDADGNEMHFTHDIDGREEIVRDRLGRTQFYVYDEQGNVLSHTNAAGETTSRTYDARGHELTITDPLGNTITNSYDANGNLLETMDALGHTETTAYDTLSSPISVTDKNGNTLAITYNDYNSPRHIINPNGATTTYWYDKFGNKTQSINEYNQTTTYTYKNKYIPFLGVVSTTGKIQTIVTPSGEKTLYLYDKSLNRISTTITLPDGTVTTTSSTYDAYDRMVTSTDEHNRTTTYEYDARGNKTSTTDAEGRVTQYEYNNHNKLTKTIYPDSTTETKTYDAMDNLLSETNREGETTTYEYDRADRLTKTTYPDGSSTNSTYDEAGRVTSTTDQNGNTTTYTYDAVGNKLSQTDALGNISKFTYDAEGNMLTATDALGHSTGYEYDAANNRIRTIYPDDSTESNTYDISGNKTSTTNQKGITTTYTYDTYNRLIDVTDALGNKTAFTYDTRGNRLTQTDALDRTTSWAYDIYGRETSRTLPLGQSQSTTYDAQGRIASSIDFNGNETSYTYDLNDRLIQTTYADGAKDLYTYDAMGRATQISQVDSSDETRTTTYTYDSMGKLTRETQPTGATLAYSYDNTGNLLTLATTNVFGDVFTTTYSYDALNRLKTVTSNESEVTVYSYDAVGNQTAITHHNGNTAAYTYNTLNRLTAISHKDAEDHTLASFDYTLSPTGERTQIVELNKTTSYTYDELGRLIEESITDPANGDYTASYTYDAVSNRVQSIIDGVTTAYSYDDNDRLTEQGGVTYTYDANGNTLTETLDGETTTYSYNSKDQLIERTTPTQTVTYSYDSNGIRSSKTVDNVTIEYLVDHHQAYAQVLQELEDGTPTVSYTYGNDLISQTRDNQTTTYHYDGLGSARYLSDETGTFTDSYDYEAFGKLLHTEGNTTNAYRYTGEQLDEESQQYYLRARYYAPTTGRFTQMDSYMGSSADPVSLHKYLYASANPVMYTDPTGHFSMMGMSAAMGIRETLQNMQFGIYSKSVDLLLGLINGVTYDSVTDFVGVGALMRTTIGLNLSLRFSSKLRKAKMLCRNSFTSQTLVATKDGLVPIEEIKIGDEVWAYNEINQTKSLQKVTHLIQGENYKYLVDIGLDSGEVITATDNHPFWELDSKSWLRAEQLSLHSLLLDIHDNNMSIDALKSYRKDGIVYNLSVANEHTFFVGSSGVLGHNCDIDEIMKKIIPKIPKKYCKNEECVPFANELIKRLKAQGIPHTPIKLQTTKPNQNIWSDSFGGNISTNGKHRAVRVGDKIYDNNNPFGVHYNSWYADLISPSGFK